MSMQKFSYYSMNSINEKEKSLSFASKYNEMPEMQKDEFCE